MELALNATEAMAVMLVMMSACHGGAAVPDAFIGNHELVSCDQAWIANGFTQCEGACVDATTALNAMGTACQGHTSVGAVDCSKTFVAQGVTGCCATQPPQVLFAECD